MITWYSTDCEQKNKAALEILQSRKEDEAEARQSNLRLTEGTPDAVHVGKGSVEAIKVEACDGKNWENFIAENPEIQQRSKKKN